MRYQFRFRNTPGNLLAMAMYTTYTSFLGMVNAVFTAAMGVLSIYSLRSGWMLLFPFALLLFFFFPIIQPMLIYLRMKKNLAGIKDDTVLSFDEKNIYVKMGDKNESHSWADISSVVERPWQVALYMGAKHGFVIPNSALGDRKKEFMGFAKSMVRAAHS